MGGSMITRVTSLGREKGDLVADSRSVLARWRNCFFQLLNVRGVNDVKQTEIQQNHKYLSQVPHEVELAIEKPKSLRSPGIDQIPKELMKAGGRTIGYEIHKLIISIWNKEELP
jgi:hypothetical protein